MAKENFNVIIMHGRATHYKLVKKFVESLAFNPIVLKDKYTGEILLNKVRDAVWDDAHCAIIVMSPDDIVEKLNEVRVRQNVVFELGYCLGAFDSIPDEYVYNSVIILKEESVADFSDIHGLEVINYRSKPTENEFKMLKRVLNKAYKKARKYYGKL